MWTIHRGYLENPNGLPIADQLIFVKQKERSYEAIALFSGEHRRVFKKDKDSLFNYLSEPLVWQSSHIKDFMEHNKSFMDKRFNRNNKTLEVKKFLESLL
jgi:hypothetical protein